MDERSIPASMHPKAPTVSENPGGHFSPVALEKNAQADRIRRIMCALSHFSAEDLAWAEARLTPAWQRRERDLAARDGAVRAALALLGARSPSNAACELERRLRRYVTFAAWHEFRRTGMVAAHKAMDELVHQIICAGKGRPLGQRQIQHIRDGHRG